VTAINTYENKWRTGFTSTKIDIKAFWLAALGKYLVLLHLALTTQKNWQFAKTRFYRETLASHYNKLQSTAFGNSFLNM